VSSRRLSEPVARGRARVSITRARAPSAWNQLCQPVPGGCASTVPHGVRPRLCRRLRDMAATSQDIPASTAVGVVTPAAARFDKDIR